MNNDQGLVQHPEHDISSSKASNSNAVRQTIDSVKWHSLNPEKKPKIHPLGRTLVIIYCIISFSYGSSLLSYGFMNEYNIFLAMGLENITLASILLLSLRVRVIRMAEFAIKISLLGVLLFYWYTASLPSDSHFSYGKFKAPGDFLLPYITALNIWIAYIAKGVLKSTTVQ